MSPKPGNRPDKRPQKRPERRGDKPRGPRSEGGNRPARKGELVVNGHSSEWLRKGFPWVYPQEVVAGERTAGGEVLVRDGRGTVLGRALTDDGWLAARVFRHDEGPLDQAWLDGVLDRALALRRALFDDQTTGWRLCNAENDGLPGVRIDHWAGHAVIHLDRPGLGRLVPNLVAWLQDNGFASAHLCYRQDPRDQPNHGGPQPGLLFGDAPEELEVLEDGLRLGVRPAEGPDVGVYADMREVRRFLSRHWRDTRVLNTFAFTAAFSVAAIHHGARQVVSVDLSQGSLDRGCDNVRRNRDDPDAFAWWVEDTFKALDRLRRTGEQFDRIILDPPSFSRSSEGVWSAKKDYPRLFAAALRVAAPDAWIIAANNTGDLSPREFSGLLSAGARKANRPYQELARLGQAPDYPAASWFPEGRYLKVHVVRV